MKHVSISTDDTEGLTSFLALSASASALAALAAVGVAERYSWTTERGGAEARAATGASATSAAERRRGCFLS